MNILTIDTLELSKRLQTAGVPQEQAEAHVRVLAESICAGAQDLVTKGDIAAVKYELKADIARLESRIDGLGKDMQAMESRLIIKLGAFFVVAVGILTAVLRMPH